MPLLYTHIADGMQVCLWRIAEGESFFAEALESTYASGTWRHVAHPAKRLQHMASRYLLHLMYPHGILMFQGRKPYLHRGPSVSISHSGSIVAVLLSQNGAGIDIQYPDEKLLRVAPRFAAYGETDALPHGTALERLTLLWCIKESIFKWYGTGIPFLSVKVVECKANRAVVTCNPFGESRRHTVHLAHIEGMMVAYVCD